MRTVVVPDQIEPAPLIDAATARARLGIPDGVGDDTIEAFVAAATALLDGPDGWLGRSLTKRQLELQAEFFPFGKTACSASDGSLGIAPASAQFYTTYGTAAGIAIKLLCPPVISIDSITFVDASGETQTLSPSAYTLNGRCVSPAYGTAWPTSRYQLDAVQIRYTAGYEDGKVPAPIIQAIVMQVATMNAMTKADPNLTQETVVGVYSRGWSPNGNGDAYAKVSAALLAPYRVID